MGTVCKDLALVTVLFDYPEDYEPSFQKNALKWFDPEDIYVARFYNEIAGGYYDKLAYYKIKRLRDFISNNLLKYKYILFLDATDTNFVKEPTNIIDRYLSYGKNIVMCAEKNMWPITKYASLYANKNIDCDFKYLNSGSYIGSVGAIYKHLDNILRSKYQEGIDDQGHWTIEYLLHDDICIDHLQKLFYSTFESKNGFEKIDGKVIFNRSDPFIIHDNGGHNELTVKLTEYINENS